METLGLLARQCFEAPQHLQAKREAVQASGLSGFSINFPSTLAVLEARHPEIVACLARPTSSAI